MSTIDLSQTGEGGNAKTEVSSPRKSGTRILSLPPACVISKRPASGSGAAARPKGGYSVEPARTPKPWTRMSVYMNRELFVFICGLAVGQKCHRQNVLDKLLQLGAERIAAHGGVAAFLKSSASDTLQQLETCSIERRFNGRVDLSKLVPLENVGYSRSRAAWLLALEGQKAYAEQVLRPSSFERVLSV